MKRRFANAAKARKLREYFERHKRILIVVDASRDDVIVPEHLRGDPALKLVLNVRMPQPIYIRDDCLESNFSFSGQPFACRIPMECIWAAYLSNQDVDDGILWEEDIPESVREVLRAVRNMQQDSQAARMSRSSPEKDLGEVSHEKGAQPRKKKHLRVVK
jgi:stringent starvation protein B